MIFLWFEYVVCLLILHHLGRFAMFYCLIFLNVKVSKIFRFGLPDPFIVKFPNHLYIYSFYLDQSEFSQKTEPLFLLWYWRFIIGTWPMQMREELKQQKSGRKVSWSKKKKKMLVANQSKILQLGHQRGQAWEANEWASGGLFRKPCFPVVPTPINCNEQLSVNLGPLLIT